jgi:ElonginA binding-protein 1
VLASLREHKLRDVSSSQKIGNGGNSMELSRRARYEAGHWMGAVDQCETLAFFVAQLEKLVNVDEEELDDILVRLERQEQRVDKAKEVAEDDEQKQMEKEKEKEKEKDVIEPIAVVDDEEEEEEVAAHVEVEQTRMNAMQLADMLREKRLARGVQTVEVVFVAGSRVPRSLRQHMLDKFLDMFVELHRESTEEALLLACYLEKQCYEQATSSVVYRNLCVQKWRRLRMRLEL